MPRTYTYTEARQKLAALLADATRDGEVRITHRSGKVFVVRPEQSGRSPLDVQGADVDISAEEINAIIREGRERDR
jgi:prevent-host-death family protein